MNKKIHLLVVFFSMIINVNMTQAQLDSTTLKITKEDTILTVYQQLGANLLTTRFDGAHFRLVGIQQDEHTISMWGISIDTTLLRYKGIFFTVKKDSDEIYNPQPLSQWKTFDWRESNTYMKVLKFLMEGTFTYKKIIYDNTGTVKEIKIMVSKSP